MANKMFPIYNMYVEGEGGGISVSLPLSCRVSIKKDTMTGQPQQADIVIFNMERSKRDMIYLDPYSYGVGGGIPVRKLTLTAGYSGYTNTIFEGMVWECYSVRSGVNYETHIKAMEGGFFLTNGMLQVPLHAKDAEDAIRQSIGKLTDIDKYDLRISPKVSEVNEQTTRIMSEYKPTIEFIKDMANNPDVDIFFEGKTINVLMRNEVISGGRIDTISADTGMLDTPRKNAFKLDIRTVFEPMVMLAQEINVVSQTEPRYNGTYRVVGYQHDVLFSNEVSGQNTSIISVLYNDVFSQV